MGRGGGSPIPGPAWEWDLGRAESRESLYEKRNEKQFIAHLELVVVHAVVCSGQSATTLPSIVLFIYTSYTISRAHAHTHGGGAARTCTYINYTIHDSLMRYYAMLACEMPHASLVTPGLVEMSRGVRGHPRSRRPPRRTPLHRGPCPASGLRLSRRVTHAAGVSLT